MDLTTLEWKKVEPEDLITAYAATGKRSTTYYLGRNQHRPEQLFAYTSTMRMLPGWYTDRTFAEDGKIRRFA